MVVIKEEVNESSRGRCSKADDRICSAEWM